MSEKLEVGYAQGIDEKSPAVLAPLERMLERLSVASVFGEPTQEGDVTVIPVAEISVGLGYGYGSSSAAAEVEQDLAEAIEAEGEIEVEEGQGPTEGGGGGGGGKAAPVGYIKITPDGVEFDSIIDETRIAMAGIALGAWTIFWFGKVLNALVKAVGAKKLVEEAEA